MCYLRLYSAMLVIGVFMLLSSCINSGNKVGGDCEYHSFTGEYRINDIELIADTISKISFLNTASDEFNYEKTESYLKVKVAEFSDIILKDTNQLYIITVDQITTGSCTPEIIRHIELKSEIQ